MKCSSFGLVRALLLTGIFYSTAARADAPHDIPGSLRIWLDGLDIYGTDTGNGGGTNPSNGASITTWKDKSVNAYVAGDATSYGATSHSYPSYSAGAGVSFNGTNNVLQVSGGIYPLGSGVTDTETFFVLSNYSSQNADSYVFMAGPVSNSANARISASVPWSDGNINWDHGNTASGGRVSTPWSPTTANQTYIYNFSSSTSGFQNIIRDAAVLNNKMGTGAYTPQSSHNFYLGGGPVDANGFHNGLIAEVIVYSRTLVAAERRILLSYLSAKYNNPGGLNGSSRYSNSAGWRYHVGGIGQESSGAVTTGTSAGMTITAGTYLANSRYLLAGLDSLTPATGATKLDAPSGYGARSQRVWYLTRTSSGTGNPNITFNLAQMGITGTTNDQMALIYRSGTTGTFSVLATATYGGTGTITFSAPNPQSGYYALAMPGSPAIQATLSTAAVADTVNSANFKAIPSALIKASGAVTNAGTGSPDANSTILVIPVPANTKLYLGDIGGAGSGPVGFTQGSTTSGLSYAFTSLSSSTDGLDFSNDSGTSWTYVPTADAQQGDAAITHIRIKPSGTFSNGTSPNFPSFTITYGLLIK